MLNGSRGVFPDYPCDVAPGKYEAKYCDMWTALGGRVAWYQTGVSDGPLQKVVAPNEFKAGGCSQWRLPAARLLRFGKVRAPSVRISCRQRVLEDNAGPR